ncbi:MAG: bifunctional hydroxymethylpyrimidine kinase/phosphomethylpyrimidine kinase, partial [Geminicoccaceae bacterium]
MRGKTPGGTGGIANILTIAGSDSGGGAGIQADLKTFSALGAYGLSVITALTAQNTTAVTAIHDAPPDMIAAQLDAVFDDIRIDAVKIGMLSRPEVIEVVADRLR